MMKAERHGTVTENLDTKIDPREDFYGYACGGWQKANPLKGEFSRFGTFDKIAEETRTQVKSLIEGLSTHPQAGTRGSIAQKVNDIYSMGMDRETRDRLGATPILPLLERIEGFREEELAGTLAWLHKGIDNPFFSMGVGPDPGDSNINMLHIGEAGLGLGDRDYYLIESDEHKRILEAYRKYIKRVTELCGYDSAAQERIYANVLKLETEMARHKKTREERRDPLLRYNVLTIDELLSEYPAIPWQAFFKASGLKEVKRVNISSKGYLEFINRYLPTITERERKDLMIFGAISSSTGVLSEAFYDADFELYDRVMSGTEEKRPLWKRAMSIPNSMFGEAVGQLYVEKYFPEASKNYMVKLVENLRKALHKHIDGLPWMGEETKRRAIEKLAALRVKIGYPDKWKDYSEIDVDPGRSYQANVLAAAVWFTEDNYSKMDEPVDRDEWFMTPQTVNAYYSPSQNEICFPAGILQPPYFDINADDALNYGAIGVVIGHEMTHGFDDQGRQYDLKGNIENWWSEEDAGAFNRLADRLVEQFDAVEVAPGTHANGRFTLGENIADQGGLRVALTAYIDSCPESREVNIDGFTPLQRFYLAYAAIWASNIRPERILSATKTDPHSLACNRVNVTLKNVDEFFDAFGIGEGDAMYLPKEDRVVIW